MTTTSATRPLTLAEAFDPRHNSVGFLRWLLAFLVIFSHAGPIGGFYGGHDLGVQVSSEQSLGGVAVAGFFFSGFLITRSRMGRASIFRYFWRRCLRIFPAYWTAFLFTVVVLAPIAWRKERGTWAGYLSASPESPLTYFVNNMWLNLNQRNIAGLGSGLPYAQLHGAYDWNGSAWTLRYEFAAYIVVGLLGLVGALAHRKIGALLAVFAIVLNGLQWTGSVNVAAINSHLANPYWLMFAAPFALGMLFHLIADKIPVDDRLAIGSLVIAVITYDVGGWNIYGQYLFMYFLMWLAIRLPLQNWDRKYDFSYGIYIFAWPLMTFSAFFGLQNQGWFVYHLTIVVGVHILAYLSWTYIEKPAMSLKDWTPRWMLGLFDRYRDQIDTVKRTVTDVRFASTRYADRIRKEDTAVPAEPQTKGR